jgi:tRNA pseudouridine55 synthase
MATGFLLIDKPPGATSHDAVAAVRRLLGQKKVGHAGTLDPMATGLLVLGLGRATRLLRFVADAPKTYVARAVFGVATDTLDADGAVLERSPMPVSEDEVAAAATRFVGDIHQVPPMVSALKVGGRRLYELAREGVTVEREARPVTIHELEILDFSPCDYPEVLLRVRCSSGTYVRTLADDLAAALGGRAHLKKLRRLAIGSLTVDDAVSLEDLAGLVEAGAPPVLDPASGLADLPAATVGEETAAGVRNGMVFPAASFGGIEGPFRVLDVEGRLLAVYAVEGRRARPEVVLG